MAGTLLAAITALWTAAAFSQGGTAGAVLIFGPLVVLAVIHRPSTGLWLILLSLPLGLAYSGLVSRLIDYALPTLILGGWALHHLYRPTRLAPIPRPLGTWFVLFVGWILITSMFSNHPLRGMESVFRYSVLGFLLVAYCSFWTMQQYKAGILAMALILVPLGSYGLWQVLNAGPLVPIMEPGAPKRLSSIYGNPNTFGVLMGHGTVILLAYFLTRRFRPFTLKRALTILAIGLGVLILFGGLLVSFSRSCYVYVAVAFLLLTLSRNRFRWLALTGVSALVALIAMFPNIFASGLRMGSGTSHRDILWRSAWRMLMENPWTGVGTGTEVFEMERSQYVETFGHRILIKTLAGQAHNVFLTKGAEMGWIGLGLTVAIFVILLIRMPAALRAFGKGNWLMGACAAAVAGMTGRALFETGMTLGLGHPTDSLIFFIFAVVLLQGTERVSSGTPAIYLPTGDLRAGRTGGQQLMQALVDRWKSSGLPVVSADECPLPDKISDHPLEQMFWYNRAYGGIRSGLLVFDQSLCGRLALLVRRIRRRPEVRILAIVQHLREAFRYHNPLYVRLMRWNETSMLRLADRVIVHTRDEARRLMERGVAGERIDIVPVGIKIPPQERIPIRELGPEDPLRLLWIGGDFVRKGIEPMLHAVALASSPRPVLTIVGKPDSESLVTRARALCRKLGVDDRVRFAGFVSDDELTRLRETHDVYVQPSLHEGHGSALDEALALGMPSIITTLPVFMERLGPDDAIFVEPGDAGALAEGLNLLRGREVRKKLSIACWQRAGMFPTWESTLDRYEDVVQREFSAALSPAPLSVQ